MAGVAQLRSTKPAFVRGWNTCGLPVIRTESMPHAGNTSYKPTTNPANFPEARFWIVSGLPAPSEDTQERALSQKIPITFQRDPDQLTPSAHFGLGKQLLDRVLDYALRDV